MSTHPLYPVRVTGALDRRLSRWLWLVKWLLAIPHLVVLAFLWVAFVLLSVVAWFAIVFTGRYPRPIFDFNVGVLRWTWRVGFYSYSALGTDRYPPFTLAEAPDYPATLDVAYPDHLSRGLVLVKWWLLALPHYLIVAVFAGGGWIAWRDVGFAGGGGLIGLLVLIAAIALLFAGRYPRSLFDFVLGLNRWCLRVVAYAALMTDAYPPFRLDMGGDEPGTVLMHSEPEAGSRSSSAAASTWTGGRIALAVSGTVIALVGAVMLAAGGAVVAIDRTQRDAQGFLMSPTETFSTGAFAIVSETLDVSVDGPDWVAEAFIGTVKVRTDATRPVFVGIAREADVTSYLGDVGRSVVTDLGPTRTTYEERPGSAPRTRPEQQSFWVASATGRGIQSLTWDPAEGDWNVVLMNADGARGVSAKAAIGAKLDPLVWIGLGVLAAGGLLAVVGVALLVGGVRQSKR